MYLPVARRKLSQHSSFNISHDASFREITPSLIFWPSDYVYILIWSILIPELLAILLNLMIKRGDYPTKVSVYMLAEREIWEFDEYVFLRSGVDFLWHVLLLLLLLLLLLSFHELSPNYPPGSVLERWGYFML